jgi:putative transposase
MKRLPPSVTMREELDKLLFGGSREEGNIISELVEKVTKLVVQELLEAEQADFLGGRGHYERRASGQHGYRGGYERGRVRTAEGLIEVQVPQVRGTGEPFRPALMSFLEGGSEVLERLVTEMYARGMSTRDVEDAFRDATGEPMGSRTAVSEVTDRLWEGYQAFTTRDLSSIEVHYLFLDAIFESLRAQGAKGALLVAWGIDAEGRKHLPHLLVGNKEPEAAWAELLRNLVSRGMRPPTTVTSDGAPGLIKAIEAVFSQSIRVRCWAHRLANVRSKLPEEAAGEVMAHVYAVRDAPALDAARAAAERFVRLFAKQYPSAVACFQDDLEALLAVHRVPVRHRVAVRTTNLAERSFEEERRRTKVVPRLRTERAAIKLVFATMMRAAERWNRLPINDLERRQLELLRAELGLDPPPAGQSKEQRQRAAA